MPATTRVRLGLEQLVGDVDDVGWDSRRTRDGITCHARRPYSRRRAAIHTIERARPD